MDKNSCTANSSCVTGLPIGSMILSDAWINEYIKRRIIRINPFTADKVNPASYDFAFSALKSLTNPEHKITDDERQTGVINILPNETFLASSLETVSLPNNICAMVTLKSSLFRRGFSIAATGWVDPGYTGTLTVQMTNMTNKVLSLKYLERAWNIIFITCPPVTAPYKGKYQNANELQEEK